jgi:hypothetical protein
MRRGARGFIAVCGTIGAILGLAVAIWSAGTRAGDYVVAAWTSTVGSITALLRLNNTVIFMGGLTVLYAMAMLTGIVTGFMVGALAATLILNVGRQLGLVEPPSTSDV